MASSQYPCHQYSVFIYFLVFIRYILVSFLSVLQFIYRCQSHLLVQLLLFTQTLAPFPAFCFFSSTDSHIHGRFFHHLVYYVIQIYLMFHFSTIHSTIPQILLFEPVVKIAISRRQEKEAWQVLFVPYVQPVDLSLTGLGDLRESNICHS